MVGSTPSAQLTRSVDPFGSSCDPVEKRNELVPGDAVAEKDEGRARGPVEVGRRAEAIRKGAEPGRRREDTELCRIAERQSRPCREAGDDVDVPAGGRCVVMQVWVRIRGWHNAAR